MANDNRSFEEKTYGRWAEIFNHFLNDSRVGAAILSNGKHVPSPVNANSKKDGFRFDKDFETKGGLSFDNSYGAMNGLTLISTMTGDNTKEVAHKIHQYIDGQSVEITDVKERIASDKVKQKTEQENKLKTAKQTVDGILAQATNQVVVNNYLTNRGLAQAVPYLNKDVISGVNSLYYNKDTKTPAMVAQVKNNQGELLFLHRTYLDSEYQKNKVVDTAKKVTSAISAGAYQNTYSVQVNNAPKTDTVHIAEGIETALAVAVINENKHPVLSTINTGGMTKYQPTNNIKNVVIWADSDESGIKAAQTLAGKLNNQNINVQIKQPLTNGHDFLDALNSRQHLQAVDVDISGSQTNEDKSVDDISNLMAMAQNQETTQEEQATQTSNALDDALSIVWSGVFENLNDLRKKGAINPALIALDAPLTNIIQRNKNKINKNYLPLGQTTKILHESGLKDIPIGLSYSKLFDIRKNHNLSKEQVKEALKQLKNPIMVFKNSINRANNSYTILTQVLDQNNKPVIVALLANRTQFEMKINKIASIYDRNIKQIEQSLNRNDLVYYDKGKAPNLIKTLGINADLTIHQTGDKKMDNKTDNTSTKTSEVTTDPKPVAQPLNLRERLLVAIAGSHRVPNFVFRAITSLGQSSQAKRLALIAAINSNSKFINQLVKDVDINKQDTNGNNMLMHAISAKNVQAVNLLLEKGIDINGIDNNKNTPLIASIISGNNSIAQAIINQGTLNKNINLNAVNEFGDSALSLAVKNNNVQIVKALLANDANATIGDNPIILAAQQSKEMLTIFASKKVLSQKDNNGRTALANAIINQESKQTINNLITNMSSKDLDIKDKVGKTALMSAINMGDRSAVALLASNSNVNLKDDNGKTALMYAVQNSDIQSVKQLITNQANLDTQDKNGDTALIHAVHQSNKATKTLIKAGVDVNTKDALGNTALIQAAKDNNVKAIMSLVAAGADMNIANKEGKTAIDIVKPLSSANIAFKAIKAAQTAKVSLNKAVHNISQSINNIKTQAPSARDQALTAVQQMQKESKQKIQTRQLH